MEDKTENNDELFVVKDMKCDSFYRGGASYYTDDLYNAKIYKGNKVPKEIRGNPDLKIVNLNSEEGLEMMLCEIHKTEHCMSIRSRSLGETIAGLHNLKNLFNRFKKEF
jgi:hypothetical protein